MAVDLKRGDANAPPIRALRPTGHSESRSERLQEFHEIGFLSPGEIQLELPVVVIATARRSGALPS
jgi:hypothetical protein